MFGLLPEAGAALSSALAIVGPSAAPRADAATSALLVSRMSRRLGAASLEVSSAGFCGLFDSSESVLIVALRRLALHDYPSRSAWKPSNDGIRSNSMR